MESRPNSAIRSLLALFLVYFILLSSGCGRPETRVIQNHVKTKTIIDCIGRKVRIPAQINRIACLCPESGYAWLCSGKGIK